MADPYMEGLPEEEQPNPLIGMDPLASTKGLQALYQQVIKKQAEKKRPDVEKLYGRLSEITRAPLDVSPLQGIAEAGREGGRRDMMGGLALQAFGGERLKPTADKMAEMGLEATQKQFRPNAADVAYENPETGELIVNPYMTRSQETKALETQIAGVEKAEDKEAQRLLQLAQQLEARGRSEEANAARIKAAEIYAGARVEAAAIRAGDEKPLKPIPTTTKKELDAHIDSMNNLNGLLTNFTDDMAGSKAVRAQVFYNTLQGGWGDKKERARANWWKDFRMFQEIPMRNKMFGSALTDTERKAWEDAQLIKPDSHPDDVRKALAGLRDAVNERQRRTIDQLHNEGRSTEAYRIPNIPYQTSLEKKNKPSVSRNPGTDAAIAGKGWVKVPGHPDIEVEK